MKLVGIIDEDFINYRKPAMVLEFPYCDFKCMKECGMQICQNLPLASLPIVDAPIESLIDRFVSNPITEAIVMQGLEPLSDESMPDVIEFIKQFRRKVHDKVDIVIYTGYNESEVSKKIEQIWQIASSYYYRGNIIIKFGRFIPNQQYHYDEVLGISLASDNQYAKIIS